MCERESDSRFGSACPGCTKPGAANYKCFECFQSTPLCKDCIVSAHARFPFHDFDFWNDSHLSRFSLSSLGLELLHGHDGSSCPFPGPKVNLTVVHSGGIRELPVIHCGCTPATKGAQAMSLWRSGLFPANFDSPRTVFTAGVLRDFHLSTLTTKITSSGY
ncbi:hypothetical protein AURDEDRAFT_76276 [Auricularia subglabra TFB-10046 SS5]|uniref:CxC2-like cysteine cluster KDZ transposase-associated domain-containing protein n=1 Tax=Auricularia subglabra (strain TFB-10046 / SS5) TaxID=717982 RepID=J0D642_AURST|nr:hypothetical protein AURDEDRAFT_76276 [Auricularia subglabra TFB-10046 SS5]